jgi:hypothetical protein
MNSLVLQLFPAFDGLVGTSIKGANRGEYVKAAPNGQSPGAWALLWSDGILSLFVRARRGSDGLIIEVKVHLNPPPNPGAGAFLAAPAGPPLPMVA